MSTLFEHLRLSFDYIILDTPALSIVSDALLLGKYADATIYVVRQNFSFKQHIEIVNDLFENAKVPNPAIIINDINMNDNYGYKKGYYSYDIDDKDREPKRLKSTQNPKQKVYKYVFYGLLLITALLVVYIVVFNYYSFKNSEDKNSTPQTSSPGKNDINTQSVSYATNQQGLTADSTKRIPVKKNTGNSTEIKSVPVNSLQVNKDQPSIEPDATVTDKKVPVKYVVKAKSYFHNMPDGNTRRSTFVLPWDDAYGIVTALDENNGFVYIVFINRAGRTSKGWILKSDLEPLKQ